jgi:hypothetical protein
MSSGTEILILNAIMFGGMFVTYCLIKLIEEIIK